MAKRKKKSTKVRRRTLSASPRRRRRRNLSAGGKMFRLVSDPLTGGLAGAILGMAVSKMVANLTKGKDPAAAPNNMIGALVPIAGGFLLKRRAPFLATGLIAGAGVSLAKDFISKQKTDSFLYKMLGDEANFVNENLLLQENIILSADGEILPYRLEDMADVLLQEMSDALPAGSMDDED